MVLFRIPKNSRIWGAVLIVFAILYLIIKILIFSPNNNSLFFYTGNYLAGTLVAGIIATLMVLCVPPPVVGKILGLIFGGIYLVAGVVHLICFSLTKTGFSLENIYHFCWGNIFGGIVFHGREIFDGVFGVGILLVGALLMTVNLRYRLKPVIRNLGLVLLALSLCLLYCLPSPLGEAVKAIATCTHTYRLKTLAPSDYSNYGVKLSTVKRSVVRATPGYNLVFIYMESTERTFLNSNLFPGLLPNLKRFQTQALDFSEVQMGPDALLTFGAMFASMTGAALTELHLRKGVNGGINPMVGYELASFPWILHQAGYEQRFLVGHSKHFAGTDILIAREGYDHLWSYVDENHLKDPDSWSELSCHDSRLYREAFTQLKELSARERPFNLTLLTLDAHGPDGFYDPAEPGYPGPLPATNLFNAMHASDAALGRFLDSVEQLPGADKLCIVIVSDHLSHPCSATPLLCRNPQRRMTFLVRAPNLHAGRNKVPGRTFDIAPTVLNLLGVRHNYTFPLGENLQGPTDSRRLKDSDFQRRALRNYTLFATPQQPDNSENGTLQVSLTPYPALRLADLCFPLFLSNVGRSGLPCDQECFRLIRSPNGTISPPQYYQSPDSLPESDEIATQVVFGRNPAAFAAKFKLPPPAAGDYYLAWEDAGNWSCRTSNKPETLMLSHAELSKFLTAGK